MRSVAQIKEDSPVEWARGWNRAAGAIRSHDGRTASAYMQRALYSWALNDLDWAISEFSAVLQLEPDSSVAWKLRGACKVQRGLRAQDRSQFLLLLEEARPDFQKWAELQPGQDPPVLDLLKLELCLGDHAATDWGRRVRTVAGRFAAARLRAKLLTLGGNLEPRSRYCEGLLAKVTRRRFCDHFPPGVALPDKDSFVPGHAEAMERWGEEFVSFLDERLGRTWVPNPGLPPQEAYIVTQGHIEYLNCNDAEVLRVLGELTRAVEHFRRFPRGGAVLINGIGEDLLLRVLGLRSISAGEYAAEKTRLEEARRLCFKLLER
jgi:tetratricopeptide (TPR) repeat protein